MKLESSLSRKRITVATSRGWPKRGLGEQARAPLGHVEHVLGHAGQDDARRHSIDQNVGGKGAGERPHQAGDAALGRAVRDVVERAAPERERAREHHAAGRLGIQLGPDRRRHVERVGQVGGDGRVPQRPMCPVQRIGPEDAGEVNQRVDRPIEVNERSGAGIGRFERRDRRPYALASLQPGRTCLQQRRADVDQQQLGALREEQLCRLARDAAPAAGDHDQPVLELHGALPSPPERSRLPRTLSRIVH